MSVVRNPTKMDPELIPTNSWLQKWASGGMSIGGSTLHPLERMRLMKDGAVFGNGTAPTPVEIQYVQEIVSSSPGRTKEFICMWYLDSAPVQIKADRLGIARSTIYADWGKHVSYVRGGLRAKGVKV